MRTLYVSDLDGTLLDGNGRLDEETIATLNGLIGAGMDFTIATARSFESAGPLLAPLELKLPAVFINGVFITDTRDGRHIREHYLAEEAGRTVLDAYLRAGLNPIVYTIDREGHPRVYYRGIHNESERLYFEQRLAMKDARFRLVSDYEPCMTERLLAVNVIDEPERLAPVAAELGRRADCHCHLGPDIYAPAYHWLEIASERATKRLGVLALKALYGYDRLVCFGDNLNDLPMFEAADESCAVAGAHAQVLAAATRIIGSNSEAGVARYLRERARAAAADGR